MFGDDDQTTTSLKNEIVIVKNTNQVKLQFTKKIDKFNGRHKACDFKINVLPSNKIISPPTSFDYQILYLFSEFVSSSGRRYKRSKIGHQLQTKNAYMVNKKCKFGDKMPPNVYNTDVLRKAKQTFMDCKIGIKNKDVIQSIVQLKHIMPYA
ncbi:Uncharacterized protein FWK35_00010193 [Aphis craccivora]|uniref:Uncharacterized protein n=1 Tax=Aphis craccivora TaxID=307492 RepID=A0A6G0YAV5_APHCR|nr:Uncharacterized protein FWK35_00010193 [Aphis craccivora]